MRIVSCPQQRPKTTIEADESTTGGGGGPYGGAERALEIAQGTGGTTLESLLSKKNIDLPEFDFFDNSITEIWNQASEAYAKQASGEVRAVLGNVRPESTWNLFEHSSTFQQVLAQFNVNNNVLIKIKYLVE